MQHQFNFVMKEKQDTTLVDIELDTGFSPSAHYSAHTRRNNNCVWLHANK